MTSALSVVDSSAWLEFFAAGPNAESFAPVIEELEGLLVPTITIVEVYKRLLAQRGAEVAQKSAALMVQGRVVPLDEVLAIEAATLGHVEQLALADSIILATARRHGATVWTMDAHFQRFGDVRYFARSA